MSVCDIRLRLVIRRHAVPEVKLVWPCTATEDLTIAKLLVDIHEVVPLESGEWGLEDYAVELADGQGGSFECLHFQKVIKVLKEGDQVVIRALSSEDLRRRRLGGRHQISADGSHLVDGVTFGRAWRPPRDRPQLRLPPRKRLRMADDESADDEDEQDDDSEDEPRQLLLDAPKLGGAQYRNSVGIRAAFDDTDRQRKVGFEEDDEDDLEAEDDDFVFDHGALEDDADFRPDNDDDDDGLEDEDMLGEDLQEELRLLQTDNAILGEDASLDQIDHEQGAAAIAGSGLLPTVGNDLSWLDIMYTLRSAFPLTSLSTLEAELKRQGQDIRRTYEALAKSNHPILSFEEMLEHGALGSLDLPESADPTSKDAVAAKPTRPLIEEVESFDIPTEEAGEENATLKVNGFVDNLSDDTSSSGSSSSSDSDETSESDSDGGEPIKSKSATRPGTLLASVVEDKDTEEESDVSSSEESSSEESSSEESSSEDDDDSSEDDAGGAGVGKDDVASPKSSDSDSSSEDSSSDSDSSDSSDDSDSQSEPEEVSSAAPVAPKEQQSVQNGQTSNIEKAPVAPHQGLSKTQKRNARRREAKRLRLGFSSTDGSAVGTPIQLGEQELLARKQALLSAFDEASPSSGKKNSDAVEPVAATENDDAQTPQAKPPTPETSAQRRSRIDLGAGRRLLFGALGLKNPKSKADEEKVRQGLMKDVRPLKNARIEVVEEVANADAADEEEKDPDWWKQRINYRAVECCHEGMVLSEPPFPFVQRWDPQQHYGSMRKRKRASQNYYEDSYYEEDSQWYGQEADTSQSHPKKKKSKGKKSKAKEQRAEEVNGEGDAMELNYDDIPAEVAGDDHAADADDLPPLPSDLATLPVLKADEVKPGMVITWKQLLLSKATNWQPQLVGVTGLVLPDSTPDNMHIVLAKRDRPQSERLYDEETGERIYDKFEVPDLDGEEDVEDDGHREISWAEMVEPRLVQREPSPSLNGTPGKSNLPTNTSQANGQPVTTEVSDNTLTNPFNPNASAQDELHVEQRSAPSNATEQNGSDASFSIESGQQIPGLDLPTLGEAVQMSTSNDSLDTTKPHAASDVANSPTRQLQETSQAAAESIRSPVQLPISEINPSRGRAATDVAGEAGSGQMTSDTVQPHTEVVMNEARMVPEPASESLGLGEAGEEIPDSNATAEHAPNGGAVSQGSIHSGRQIQPDYGLEEPSGAVDELVIPETVLEAHATTPPTAEEMPQTQASSADSSPLPSLEEIFHTATTSRRMTSPVKPTARSQPSKLNSDSAYDEAMRRLDEGEDSEEESPDKNKTIRSLFPNATQPAVSTDLPDLKEETPRATRTRSERLRRRSAQFKVPEGSQVISIGSSPISAHAKEDYAEDSVDETYKPTVTPTKTQGSAQKHVEEEARQGSKGRKKSLPRVPSATTARVLKTKQAPSANKGVKGLKKRWKTGERF